MLIAEYNYETDMAVKHQEGIEEGIAYGEMKKCIEMCQRFKTSKEEALEIFKETFPTSSEKLASQYVEKYWKK